MLNILYMYRHQRNL